MNHTKTFNLLGQVDIYVIDQILKNRYLPQDIILDAGCGEGRNLKWFYANDFPIYGIDADSQRLDEARLSYPKAASNLILGELDALPYEKNKFNHIICSAVLHFAQSEKHFFAMFSELIRVLKHNGTLFIRMASNIGLDGNAPYLTESKTNRPGTYFLKRETIVSLLEQYSLELIEPIKTTNVQDERAMTTLVMRKK